MDHRISQGLPPCSSERGAYCQARRRLPERFFSAVARLVGRRLDERVDARWLWKGRRGCLFDGSTVSMPDTPENRAEYPLTYNQRPGTCFPVARIGAIISLSCGAILDLGICRYAGKSQREVSLLRRLWDVLRPGDVLLGDRLMSNWVGIHLLQQRGIAIISRLNKAVRKADFRKGTRLGKDDHLVVWKKPTSIRSVDRAVRETPRMNTALERLVWHRANSRREYCQLPQAFSPLPHVIDHIISRQHQDPTVAENLALACCFCKPDSRGAT